MNKICKNCKYRDKEGKCKKLNKVNNKQFGKDTLIYSSFDCYSPWVGPDFGCIHFTEKTPKFERDQIVLHIKSGIEYKILEVPDNQKLLEGCSEPYYRYKSIKIPGPSWIRKQSEMEDGRFRLIKDTVSFVFESDFT
jgi:hypothetical protein